MPVIRPEPRNLEGLVSALFGDRVGDDVQIECAIDLGRTLTESLLSQFSERIPKSPACDLLLRMDFVMSFGKFLPSRLIGALSDLEQLLEVDLLSLPIAPSLAASAAP